MIKRGYLYFLLGIAVVLLIAVFLSPELIQLLPSPEPESFSTSHEFYGSVKFADGSPVINGEVYAVADNVVLISQKISKGYYGGSSNAFAVENLEQDTPIDFYISISGDSRKVTSSLFFDGGLTNLDLVYFYCGDAVCSNGEVCSSCSIDCGVCAEE